LGPACASAWLCSTARVAQIDVNGSEMAINV
jgi:hypothetical protein